MSAACGAVAEARVPVRIAAPWGAGTSATTTILNGIAAVLLLYLVNFVKREPVPAGAMLFGAKLLDVSVSPPMGLWSDRTQVRWVRRRPFLFGASLPPRRMDKRNACCRSLLGYCAVMSSWLLSGPDDSLWLFAARADGRPVGQRRAGDVDRVSLDFRGFATGGVAAAAVLPPARE